MLQCVAVCCSVMQFFARVYLVEAAIRLPCVAVSCCELQCVAVCFSVLQRVAVLYMHVPP